MNETIIFSPKPNYKGRGLFEPETDLKRVVFEAIETYEPVNRGELVKVTGVPRTTLYDTIVRLILDKQVRKFAVNNKKRGRPKIYYKIIK